MSLDPGTFGTIALVAAVSAVLVRRLVPQAYQPSVIPAPVARPAQVTVRYTDEWAEHLAVLRALGERAQDEPGRRQEFAHQVFTQLRSAGRYRDGQHRRDLQPVILALLTRHLRPEGPEFWPGVDLDFECGGVLRDVDLSWCRVRSADFSRIRFEGDARFRGATFTGVAKFEGSCFARHVSFRQAEFGSHAVFHGTTFTGTAAFQTVTVAGRGRFCHARFSALTDFTGAKFTDTAFFNGARFNGRTSFQDTAFAALARFDEARFNGHADFAGASTEEDFLFADARARTDVHAIRTWPAGWTLRPADPIRTVPIKGKGVWSELRPAFAAEPVPRD